MTRWLLPLAFVAACSGPSGPDPSDAGEPLHDAGAEPDAGTPPACIDGVPAQTYPADGTTGLVIGRVLPRLSWVGLDPDGEVATLDTADVYEPCAERSRLLVLRTMAGWCGPCRWHATHTSELTALGGGARVLVADLLVGDDDHFLPDEAALASWRARLDAPAWVLADPGFSLDPVEGRPAPLPRLVVVDTRTMEIRFALPAPNPDVLLQRLESELAILDGQVPTFTAPPDKVEGRFDRLQWALLQEMTLPGAPPPDPTNAVADDPAAARLGETLFHDTGLSPSGTVSCATCHDPSKGFADGRAVSVGVAAGDRNAPGLMFAAHARWQFWDGRADTLWGQAVAPFENPLEFGSSRTFVAKQIAARHSELWTPVFDPPPDLSDPARFPDDARPGTPSWEAMSEADRVLVTDVFVKAGKSIAAFERTLRAKVDRFDAWQAGETSALTDMEKDGALAFLTSGCVQCHYGPRLTDDAFHNVRFPTGRRDGAPDRGLADGFPLLLADPFSGEGPWSDAPCFRVHDGRRPGERSLGAFRTPTLRGLADTAPYGHGGTFATLSEVLDHYAVRGLPADDPRALGGMEPWVPRFAANHGEEIVAFLHTLGAERADD